MLLHFIFSFKQYLVSKVFIFYYMFVKIWVSAYLKYPHANTLFLGYIYIYNTNFQLYLILLMFLGFKLASHQPCSIKRFDEGVTKKEEHPECFQAPCLTPPLEDPVHPLRGTVCLLLPWLATAWWLPCRTYTMQLAITQTESTSLMPHNTTNN